MAFFKCKYKKFENFYHEHDLLPESVTERFRTFTRLVCFDPDDKSLKDLCRKGPHFPDAPEALAYPLGRGWYIYWDVERNIAGEPLRVPLLGFRQIPGAV